LPRAITEATAVSSASGCAAPAALPVTAAGSDSLLLKAGNGAETCLPGAASSASGGAGAPPGLRAFVDYTRGDAEVASRLMVKPISMPCKDGQPKTDP